MMRTFFKILSLMADARSVRKGPAGVVKRQARKRAHRAVTRWLS
jgi:hypothetical protein